MKIGIGPLPGPLRKYEPMIKEVIWDLGVTGKTDEFVREGKVAIYNIENELYSKMNEAAKDTFVYRSIKNHLLKFIVVQV
ncbi:hypothetical protein [Halobacillus litoralis]|uniref:Uncharacterized protein n=1 Tax=Halobacillus litoralis TaxID=45668 RepID=A0A410MFH0_9BACI|nr:hypothetical protein [Halobacillus litoralis]QAS53396.1 hypothetical protein HLI_14925 [Halobacillus litoralis]